MQSENTAERVKAFRASLGLTVEKMAGIFGVTPRTIRNWESGADMPTTAQKLMEQATTLFRVEGDK